MGRGDRKKPLPALAPVKSRAKPPRNRGRFAKPAEDARNTALDGRLRQFGGLCSPDARQAISGQHMGESKEYVRTATIRVMKADIDGSAYWDAHPFPRNLMEPLVL